MELGLRGRTALITGGSRGIGEAIAREFAAEGVHLHLAATDRAKLEAVRDALVAEHGVSVTIHVADLSKQENIAALCDAVGEIDILVNNAGAIPRGNITEVGPAAWRRGWDLKVFGYIDMIRIILPRMEAAGRGVIVNVIGLASERAEPRYIATCTGNAALLMLTQCLGGESMRHGVRVVGVNPGPIMSDRHLKGAMRVAEQQLGSADKWPELYARFPIGRPGRVDEVAHAVAFLASDLASYISGEVLRIDAGLKVRDPVY